MIEPTSPKAACLLIHGFAGSPFDLEALAPTLEGLGCTVDLPTLPGHGTSIEDFRRTFFPDWLAYAEERLLFLQKNHEKVILIGFSLGASIALHLGGRYAPTGILAFAPAWQAYSLWPLNRSSWMVLNPVLQYIRPVIAIRPPRPESRAIAPFKGYDGVLCLPQLHSLSEGLKDMRRQLPGLTCPLRMVYDRNDKLCPPESGAKIAQQAGSADVTLRYTLMQERITNHHMITTHRDTRDIARAEAEGFVKRMLGMEEC